MKTKLIAFIFATISVLLSGCVHEWPEEFAQVNCKVTIKHDLNWTEYDFNVATRRNNTVTKASRWQAKYIFKAFPEGETKGEVFSQVIFSDDLTLAPFTADLNIPEGDWDLYIWQDLVDENGKSFYNTDNFAAITYNKPYVGNSNERDAFQGMVTVHIPRTYNADQIVEVETTLTRPLAKYVFIATDFDKFITETVKSGNYLPVLDGMKWEQLNAEQRKELLKGYSVVTAYPYFMPSVFNEFTQKITDSARGMSYEGSITPISANEAVIAFDYTMINHRESGVEVQIGLRTPDGKLVALTSIISVPIKRSQITYVRGNFLTSNAGSGIDIDFSFGGDFNIPIR